jgi:biopolymer transport protein ExbB/TolQ
MNYLVLAGVVSITILAYFIYSQNKIANLTQKNAEYAQQTIAAQQAVEALRASVERQARLLEQLSTQKQEAEVLRDKALEALETNDLRSISERKPELVETRINRGTRNVFEEIERITR